MIEDGYKLSPSRTYFVTLHAVRRRRIDQSKLWQLQVVVKFNRVLFVPFHKHVARLVTVCNEWYQNRVHGAAITLLRSAYKRIVNIIKVYIEGTLCNYNLYVTTHNVDFILIHFCMIKRDHHN